jgi:hypothetical protein
VWPGELLEVSQLLDLAVFPFDPREVGRLDKAPVACPLVIGDHVGERPI